MSDQFSFLFKTPELFGSLYKMHLENFNCHSINPPSILSLPPLHDTWLCIVPHSSWSSCAMMAIVLLKLILNLIDLIWLNNCIGNNSNFKVANQTFSFPKWQFTALAPCIVLTLECWFIIMLLTLESEHLCTHSVFQKRTSAWLAIDCPGTWHKF